MKRWKQWGGLALAVMAAGGLASRVVISQQPLSPPLPPPPRIAAPALPEGRPAQVLLGPLRPHLEAVLGQTLEAVPEIRVVSAAELAAVPDAGLDAYLHLRFPQLRDGTLATTRQVARQIMASATIAQHVEGTGVILVVLDAPGRIAHWDESLAAGDHPGMIQLAVIHEMVRFLLDRRYHLGALRAACRDGEEYQTLEAVIEGRAQWVTRQVADLLGVKALFPLLARRYQYVPDDASDPGLRAVSQTALRDRQQACLQGEHFFSYLEEVGQKDIEGRVFARLPRQGSVLLRPDIWLRAVEKDRPELASVLQKVQPMLPGAEWQAQQQTWTPAMLVQAAGMLGVPRERVEKLESAWDEGRSLIWANRQHPEQQVALSVVRLQSPGAARAYFGFAVDLQRKQDGPLPGGCGTAIRVLESQSCSIILEGFDETVRYLKKIQYGSSAPVAVQLLLARAGDLVVECTWYGETVLGLAENLAQAVRAGAR